MPFYEYKCTNKRCQTDKFDLMQFSTEEHKADCPDCEKPARRMWHLNGRAVVKFREGWHDGLGEYVNTKREEDNLLQKHGLHRKT